MNHGSIDIDRDPVIPVLEKLELAKDPMSGWNLHILTQNFKFTPANAGAEHVAGEGHAHLMINGLKIARIYSDWFHIPEVDGEIKELEVSLNANSHAVMHLHGKPVSLKLYDLEPSQDGGGF